MREKKPFSGSGAAHIGFPMFGARGPLRAPEDDGNGAGGSGTPPQQQQAAPAPQPGSPAITPELRALIEAETTKAKNAAFAEARRLFEGKNKGEPKPPRDTKTETNNADDPSSLLALRDAFDDATSDLKLSKGQRQILRENVMSKRPSDVDQFVSDFAERAGWAVSAGAAAAAQDTTVKNNNTPADAKPPAGRPLSDHGSPAGTPSESSSDVLKWTLEDVERFYQSKGGKTRRENGELDLSGAQNASIHRELRKMAQQRLASVRIQLGPRRAS